MLRYWSDAVKLKKKQVPTVDEINEVLDFAYLIIG